MDNEHKHVIEYNLKLDSNPEFTGSVIVAYARAAYRMSKEGMSGCKTVFDIARLIFLPEVQKTCAHICCKGRLEKLFISGRGRG